MCCIIDLYRKNMTVYDAAFLARDFTAHSVAKPQTLKFISKTLSWCKAAWHNK